MTASFNKASPASASEEGKASYVVFAEQPSQNSSVLAKASSASAQVIIDSKFFSTPTSSATQPTLHVVVDNPTQSPSMWTLPATWSGFAALVLSILSLWLTLRKDKKAAQKSINDDFWIRKVLFEHALNPVLEFMSDTIDHLPKQDAKKANIQSFLNGFNKKHRNLAGKLGVGSVLDSDLFKKTISEFETFEDLISDFCTLMLNPSTDLHTYATARSEITSKIQQSSLNILNAVKEYQQRITHS